MTIAKADLPASVFARLHNKARESGRSVNELLQYFAMERFLYRLSHSDYADQFLLKGALMLYTWGVSQARATKDIDLLGRTPRDAEDLVAALRTCMTVPCEDGVQFLPESLVIEEMKHETDYPGLRCTFRGHLGKVRLHCQVDVGFGDMVAPAPIHIEYPTILNLPAPRLLAYRPETAIAEKLHAMTVLGAATSRMKDLYDIDVLIRELSFQGEVLAEALEVTFRGRGTRMPEDIPHALTDAFAANPMKQSQWAAFLRRIKVSHEDMDLGAVVGRVRSFLTPVLLVVKDNSTFQQTWPPGGPWREAE
ncbi:MAG: nucleotidyl transferase AbiEii/AbiGii toxin family protein [Armatimonadetes bacterium]|nr:nucleotidyl transferase AbiEii/AbiGii toxin family protein [Armatimonadota bacterium]